MVAALAGGSLNEETLDVASYNYALVSQNPNNAIFPPQKQVRPWPYRRTGGAGPASRHIVCRL